MSIADRGQPVEVNVGECRCPGAPHTQDLVWLKPQVDVPMTMAFNVTWTGIEGDALNLPEWQADMQAALAGVYLRHSIQAWSFVDEKGDGVPIKPSTIAALLPAQNGGLIVVEAADALYQRDLVDPLLKALETAKAAQAATLNRELRRQMKKSSPRGQTEPSTSATPNSGISRPTLSAPSSPVSMVGRKSAG